MRDQQSTTTMRWPRFVCRWSQIRDQKHPTRSLAHLLRTSIRFLSQASHTCLNYLGCCLHLDLFRPEEKTNPSNFHVTHALAARYRFGNQPLSRLRETLYLVVLTCFRWRPSGVVRGQLHKCLIQPQPSAWDTSSASIVRSCMQLFDVRYAQLFFPQTWLSARLGVGLI